MLPIPFAPSKLIFSNPVNSSHLLTKGEKMEGIWMQITLTLTPEEYRQLRAKADRDSQDVSQFIKEIVRHFLDSQGNSR